MSDQDKLELEVRASELVASSPWTTKLDRYLQIVRYYRWKQVALRAKNVLSKKLVPDRVIGRIENCDSATLVNCESFTNLAVATIADNRDHISHTQNDLTRGRLVLLNESFDVGWPIKWDVEEPSHLWRFQLHYHEYLLQHVSSESALADPTHQAWEDVWGLLVDWINRHSPENSKSSQDAWHPYCISRRIPVWSWLLSARTPSSDSILSGVLKSLSEQAVVLSQNLEKDLGGNHLFENYTALAIAGCIVKGPHSNNWLDVAEGGLKKELPRQTLDHGEHFERSPMYHCQILGNVLKIAIMSEKCRPRLSAFCTEYAARFLEFVESICHSDGEIPLLGDSCFHEAPSMDGLRKLASFVGVESKSNLTTFSQAGPYWIYRENCSSESDFFLFDRGPVAPDELPAHGHCDLLNLEASVGGNRWIVDSGNYFYESGSMRQYCRSSVAHNVLTIDGQNQCDIYSKFRMGRRGRIKECESGNSGEFDWAKATHDGYRSIGISRVERLIAISHKKKVWICCDIARGSSTNRLLGYLHLGPELTVNPKYEDGKLMGFTIGDNRITRSLRFFGTIGVRILDGWYCHAFGFRQKNTVVEYQLESINAFGGWLLCESDCEYSINCSSDGVDFKGSQGSPNFEWNFN